MILSINLPYMRSTPGSFVVCRDRYSGKRVGIWTKDPGDFWLPYRYHSGSVVSLSEFWLNWIQELEWGILVQSLSIFRHKKRWICNECFNALPIEQRKGRGARPHGWVPPDAKRHTCCVCQREGIYLSPAGRAERGLSRDT